MDFSHLNNSKFWFKTISIILWSLYLSIYIWLFSYLMESDSHLDKFISVAVSVLIGGLGFNYISNIYNTPFVKFNNKSFYSALTIFAIFGAAIWAIWIYVMFPIDEKSFFSMKKYTAGLVFVYFITMFLVPIYILSRKQSD